MRQSKGVDGVPEAKKGEPRVHNKDFSRDYLQLWLDRELVRKIENLEESSNIERPFLLGLFSRSPKRRMWLSVNVASFESQNHAES